jgi:hypothetical protein
MWNPEQDARALVREFLDGYYGPAGKALLAYQELLARQIGSGKVASWSGPREAGWLTLPAMNRATEYLEAAAASVAADPTLTARVQRARLSLDHQWLCSHAGYRYLADHSKTPFRGPVDFSEAIESFAAQCRTVGVEKIGYSQAQTLDAYVQSLRLAGEVPAGRFILATDPTYKTYLAGARMPLPPPLDRLPVRRVVDIHEDRMSVFRGAELTFDPNAVNHGAARLDPAVVSWSVQVRDLPAKGVKGRWHAYAVVRVEALAESGLAFTAGVYDSGRNRNLLGISQRLEGQAGGTPDPNIASERTTALAEPITDGAYRVYDFGSHEFHDGTYLWVGTTGGVDREAVKAIWVDRFLFVRDSAPR